MGKKLDINPGDRYNRLTIIGEVEMRGKHRRFNCKCDCGNEIETFLTSLRTGDCKSCGCLHREIAKKLGKETYKHNKCDSVEYSCWKHIKQRCYNLNSFDYKNYGGRGIKVCDRWFNSFENFFEDMGIKPDKTYSIDRIDNNGNYEPSNCRWSTPKEQRNNQRPRTNKKISDLIIV